MSIIHAFLQLVFDLLISQVRNPVQTFVNIMENKALEPQTSSQQGTGVYTSESLQVSIS